MTAMLMSRKVLPIVALVAVAGIAAVLAFQYVRREPPADTKVVSAAPTSPNPVSSAPDQASPVLATAQAAAGALAAALGGSAVPDRDDGMPSFDIARIEPTGEAVIAGRAAPGATVELLRNGEVHDRAVADQAGQFAMVPPQLPAGNYELKLRITQPDGKQVTSKQSVAVALAPSKTDRPVVALMTPAKPTVVLSQPTSREPVAGTVVVEAVEVEQGGKLHVSGRARAGAAVRFYLNDSFVASVTAAADGRFAVTINEGVAPGNYRVRLDEMDANASAVRARAEVPFNVPATVVTGTVPTPAREAKRTEVAAAAQPQPAAAAASVKQDAAAPASAVVVPKIETATVSRGDSLWRISHLTYGAGMRYAVIYQANREQIRNPDLIYPGQVFVLPTGAN